jgi:hypothetical protein
LPVNEYLEKSFIQWFLFTSAVFGKIPISLIVIVYVRNI